MQMPKHSKDQVEGRRVCVLNDERWSRHPRRACSSALPGGRMRPSRLGKVCWTDSGPAYPGAASAHRGAPGDAGRV